MKNQDATALTRAKFAPHDLAQARPTTSVAMTGALVLAILAPYVTGYMLVATLNLFLLLIGFTLRHHSRKAHAAFMSMGILSDLAIVLLLQLQRDAIQTAVARSLTALNQAHILASTLTTALYIPMAVIGVALYFQKKTESPTRKQVWHRNMGWATLIFRTLGFFLMFSMLGRHPAP